MRCWRLDEHQQCGDDPQKVEDAAEHGQLLLFLGEVNNLVAAFKGGEGLLLTWDDYSNEDYPRDDCQQDGNVEAPSEPNTLKLVRKTAIPATGTTADSGPYWLVRRCKVVAAPRALASPSFAFII